MVFLCINICQVLKEHRPPDLVDVNDKKNKHVHPYIFNKVKRYITMCSTAHSDRIWFFNTLTFARSLGRCRKPRPSALVFNTSLGTWRMFDPYIVNKFERCITMKSVGSPYCCTVDFGFTSDWILSSSSSLRSDRLFQALFD